MIPIVAITVFCTVSIVALLSVQQHTRIRRKPISPVVIHAPASARVGANAFYLPTELLAELEEIAQSFEISLDRLLAAVLSAFHALGVGERAQTSWSLLVGMRAQFVPGQKQKYKLVLLSQETGHLLLPARLDPRSKDQLSKAQVFEAAVLYFLDLPWRDQTSRVLRQLCTSAPQAGAYKRASPA
jgi:hypothetical protein